MNRLGELTLQIGGKKTGKTHFCKRWIRQGCYDKVLIIEASDEYAEFDNDKECTRMVWNNDNKLAISKALNDFHDGFLIVEDIFSDKEKMTTDFLGLISCLRSKRIDVVMNFQTVKMALNPKIASVANVLRIFKTNETTMLLKKILKYNNNMFDYFAKAEVHNYESKDPYSFIRIEVD